MRCKSNCAVCGFISEGALVCCAQRTGAVRNIPRSKGNFNFLGIRPAKIRASRALIRGRVEYFISASLEFTRSQNPEVSRHSETAGSAPTMDETVAVAAWN